MINLCNELKLTIESSIPEDENLPTKQVHARTSSQQAIEIPPKEAEQALIERIKQAAENSRQDVIESSTQVAARSSEQVAESSNVGTSTQRPGKEKVKEVEMMEIPKMAEDSNEMQFDFQLRWLTEEASDNDFVIFSPMFLLLEPGQAAQVPVVAPQVPAVVNPLHQHGQLPEFCDFCCCCCCPACNPF